MKNVRESGEWYGKDEEKRRCVMREWVWAFSCLIFLGKEKSSKTHEKRRGRVLFRRFGGDAGDVLELNRKKNVEQVLQRSKGPFQSQRHKLKSANGWKNRLPKKTKKISQYSSIYNVSIERALQRFVFLLQQHWKLGFYRILCFRLQYFHRFYNNVGFSERRNEENKKR